MENLNIREDGYVNVTNLCKVGNKHFKHWNRLKRTQLLLKELEIELNLPRDKFLIIKQGNKGSWAHPYVALDIARWISVKFGIKIAKWIDEWKQISDNEVRYNNAINNIEPDLLQDSKEATIRDSWEGGEKEVETPAGFIDIVTDTEIIEIKKASKWKHALGQFLSYSEFYKKKTKRIHLFDHTETNIKLVQKIFDTYDVKLTLEK